MIGDFDFFKILAWAFFGFLGLYCFVVLTALLLAVAGG